MLILTNSSSNLEYHGGHTDYHAGNGQDFALCHLNHCGNHPTVVCRPILVWKQQSMAGGKYPKVWTFTPIHGIWKLRLQVEAALQSKSPFDCKEGRRYIRSWRGPKDNLPWATSPRDTAPNLAWSTSQSFAYRPSSILSPQLGMFYQRDCALFFSFLVEIGCDWIEDTTALRSCVSHCSLDTFRASFHVKS